MFGIPRATFRIGGFSYEGHVKAVAGVYSLSIGYRRSQFHVRHDTVEVARSVAVYLLLPDRDPGFRIEGHASRHRRHYVRQLFVCTARRSATWSGRDASDG